MSGWLVEVSIADGEWVNTHIVLDTPEEASAYVMHIAEAWRGTLGIRIRGTRISHVEAQAVTHSFSNGVLVPKP